MNQSDNRRHLKPVVEALNELLEGRKSRSKYNAAFWQELRNTCEDLVAADPSNIEFIEPSTPLPFYYSRTHPHVLTHQVCLIVRLKRVPHCLFVTASVALTEDPEAELIGKTGIYLGESPR